MDFSRWGFKWSRANSFEELLDLLTVPAQHNAVEMKSIRITQDEIQALPEAVAATRLKAISISQAHLEDAGLNAVLEGLVINRFVTHLYLQDNFISTHGATYVRGFLRTNTTLQYLDLQYNFIDDGGAQQIADGLGGNSTLKSLCLGFNNIGSNGEAVLNRMLEVHKSLRYLGLYYTNLNTLDAIQRKEFRNAIMEGDKGLWLRSKLMLVGQGRAGKTATVRTLTNKPFVPNQKSTIGVELSQTQTKVGESGSGDWSDDRSKTIADYVTDFATRVALERTRKLMSGRQKGSVLQGAVQALGSAISGLFLGAGGSDETKERKDSMDEAPIVLSKDEEVARLEKYNAKLFIQAKAGQTLSFSIWDYGGQKVFYTLHHLFLTQYGVYLLVFNMHELLNNTANALEFMSYWLDSIQLHASEAPIVLCGTHADKIKRADQLERVDKVVRDQIKRKTKNVKYNIQKGKGNLSFFPLDNKNRTDMTNAIKLRKAIETAAKTLPFLDVPISSRWICCIDKLLALKKNYVSMAELKEICKPFGVTSADTINNMLHLFHELGVVIYLTTTQALRDIIVIQPQWLIDKIGKVIRDKDIHLEKALVSNLNSIGLDADLNELTESGLATIDLLNELWSNEQVHFLLDFMRETYLLCDWNFQKEVLYCIPSMLTKEMKQRPKIKCYCILDFSKRSLPTGVFQRLACVLVSASVHFKASKKTRTR